MYASTPILSRRDPCGNVYRCVGSGEIFSCFVDSGCCQNGKTQVATSKDEVLCLSEVKGRKDCALQVRCRRLNLSEEEQAVKLRSMTE